VWIPFKIANCWDRMRELFGARRVVNASVRYGSIDSRIFFQCLIGVTSVVVGGGFIFVFLQNLKKKFPYLTELSLSLKKYFWINSLLTVFRKLNRSRLRIVRSQPQLIIHTLR
jgi:hypothetical protein